MTEKFGPKLRIHENGKLVTELFYPESLKTQLKFFERGLEGYVTNLDEPIKYTGLDSKNKRKARECALCSATQELELHRINPPQVGKRKTPKGDYNRKTITLCMSCHRSSHGIHGTQNKFKDLNLGKLKT